MREIIRQYVTYRRKNTKSIEGWVLDHYTRDPVDILGPGPDRIECTNENRQIKISLDVIAGSAELLVDLSESSETLVLESLPQDACQIIKSSSRPSWGDISVTGFVLLEDGLKLELYYTDKEAQTSERVKGGTLFERELKLLSLDIYDMPGNVFDRLTNQTFKQTIPYSKYGLNPDHMSALCVARGKGQHDIVLMNEEVGRKLHQPVLAQLKTTFNALNMPNEIMEQFEQVLNDSINETLDSLTKIATMAPDDVIVGLWRILEDNVGGISNRRYDFLIRYFHKHNPAVETLMNRIRKEYRSQGDAQMIGGKYVLPNDISEALAKAPPKSEKPDTAASKQNNISEALENAPPKSEQPDAATSKPNDISEALAKAPPKSEQPDTAASKRLVLHQATQKYIPLPKSEMSDVREFQAPSYDKEAIAEIDEYLDDIASDMKIEKELSDKTCKFVIFSYAPPKNSNDPHVKVLNASDRKQNIFQLVEYGDQCMLRFELREISDSLRKEITLLTRRKFYSSERNHFRSHFSQPDYLEHNKAVDKLVAFEISQVRSIEDRLRLIEYLNELKDILPTPIPKLFLNELVNTFIPKSKPSRPII